MPSWKQVNEVGGAIILRGVAGLVALLCVYGTAVAVWNGTITARSVAVLASMILLFGGYAVFGNRLSVNHGVLGTKLLLDAEDNPHRRDE